MSLNVAVIKASFERVKPNADKTVTRFYEILWTDYPESKALFANVDIPLQKEAFIKALGYIVENLDDTAKLVNYLRAMGGRHANYGLDSELPFQWMGNSLIKALGEGLGTAWTTELLTEWTAAYAIVSGTMIEGMKSAHPVRRDNVTSFKSHKPTAVASPSQSNSFELPANVVAEISRAAHDFVQARLEKEYQNAIRAEMEKLNGRDFLNSIKKVG